MSLYIKKRYNASFPLQKAPIRGFHRAPKRRPTAASPLANASRIARLTVRGGPVYPGLLERVIGSALAGLASFAGDGSLDLPAGRRLAFRELGLSIGLAGVEEMSVWIGENPHRFDRAGPLSSLVQALEEYVPLRETIEGFWLVDRNRESATWTEHREINTVMLATSLAPAGFLGI